jgi:putative transposase
MADERSEQREHLIERIRRLSADRLRYVEELLTHLECGDWSPLSLALPGGTSEAQRLAAQVAAAKSGTTMLCMVPVPHSKDWPHAPVHRLSEHGTYMVTAGTLHKEHWFRGPERLDLLESALLRLVKAFGWQVEAWAVFSNHYHFVAHAGPGAENLRVVLKRLHGETSRELNSLDAAPGRRVWHNFWDTKLTFEKSYLARLNYVHQNAVKHGLVPVANQYRWCSAGWFERAATRAQARTIYSFRTDRLSVRDDYEPI